MGISGSVNVYLCPRCNDAWKINMGQYSWSWFEDRWAYKDTTIDCCPECVDYVGWKEIEKVKWEICDIEYLGVLYECSHWSKIEAYNGYDATVVFSDYWYVDILGAVVWDDHVDVVTEDENDEDKVKYYRLRRVG